MNKVLRSLSLALMGALLVTARAEARDIEYKNAEVTVYVTPGEPSEVRFPGKISGGYKRSQSAIAIERKGSSLVLYASEGIQGSGEAIIVGLDDGRSYSLRVARATDASPRDASINVIDARGAVLTDSEEEPAYREKNFEHAPASQVSGLMREMVLVAELGKATIPGYRATDSYKGQEVMNDGAMTAKIDRIFIGPNLWGYVLDAENLLDSNQKINPATFRLDGTRAISATNWELAAKPLTIEQQLAGKDKTKVYIVTRARKTS